MGQRLGHPGQGGLLAEPNAVAQRVCRVARICCWQKGVDHERLVVQPDLLQFRCGAGCFGERAGLGAGDEHELRQCRVAETLQRNGIHRSCPAQPSHRAEARRITLALVEEGGPIPRQVQQPDGVPGGRGVEDDMVVTADAFVVGEQAGELVERRDLGRAGPRELLGDRGDVGGGEQVAHRADNALSVCRGGGFGVDLEGIQTGDCADRGDPVADGAAEDLTDVGGRIGAHEQHAPAGVGQLHSGGAGQ